MVLPHNLPIDLERDLCILTAQVCGLTVDHRVAANGIGAWVDNPTMLWNPLRDAVHMARLTSKMMPHLSMIRHQGHTGPKYGQQAAVTVIFGSFIDNTKAYGSSFVPYHDTLGDIGSATNYALVRAAAEYQRETMSMRCAGHKRSTL